MQAFHNDPALKAILVAQLAAHAAAGQVKPGLTFWNNGEGSPVGCLIHDTSLAAWRQRTGIPMALALALDALAAHSMSPELAARLALEWTEAVPLGGDLRGVASALLAWLLTDATLGTIRLAADDADRQLIRRIADLHRRNLSGDRPTAAEWREARAVATQATDERTGLPQWLTAIAERAAWDTETARTVVSDTLQYWFQVHRHAALRELGWTPQDDKEAHERMTTLQAEARSAGRNDLARQPRELLEAHHPALAARLRAKDSLMTTTCATCATAAGNVLIAASREAAAQDDLSIAEPRIA